MGTTVMSAADGEAMADELQRHARWLRRLASALLRDSAAADDLVQEACLAALTHPPAGRLRPWLRKVAHNFARRHHRGMARRVEREGAARPPTASEAPDQLAQRLETEQRLSRELAALEEPFRSTLMLRYYEDLAPAEIAARLGVPGGTVRWRLMRGLALLRERLDRAHGGDRRAWCIALLPLARLDGAAGAGAAATAVALPGVLLMNVLKLSAAAAALLVLAVGLSLSGFLPEFLSLAHRERPLEVVFRPLELETGDASVRAMEVQPAAEPERVALATDREAEPDPADTPLAATIDARFFGRGRALSGARLVVVHQDTRQEALSAGPDGLASCTFALGEPRELVNVELLALGYASEERSAVCEQGGTTHLGRIDLVPGGAVSGRILDEHGVGLADCRVTLGSIDQPFPELEAARLSPPRERIPSCTSDTQGNFRLLGVAQGMTRLWAHAAGMKSGYTPPFEVRAGQESTGVELVLEPLAPENLLRGIVVDPAGNAVPHARIEYRHSFDGGNSVRSGESNADGGGRFEFRLREDARSWLRASDPARRWSSGSLSDVENGARELVLQLREAREIELAVTSGASALETFAVELLGVEREAEREELAEELGAERAAELVAQYSPRLGGIQRGDHAGGRARLVLPDETFLLRVLAPAHRVFQLGPLDPDRVAARIECTLEPVPGISGIVLRDGNPVPGVRVELQAAVDDDMKVVTNGYRVRVHPDVHDEARTDGKGHFLLTARVAGSYFVRAEPDAGAPAEVGPLAVDVALGGPPIEVHLGPGGAIEGRVKLAGNADPEGAIVGITRGDSRERTQRVASDGLFRFESLIPGPWRVELRDEEVFGASRSMESTRGPRVEPFELEANCTVHEGKTTFVDVTDVMPEAFAFEGSLRIDDRAAVGWTAKLGPVGRLEVEGEDWTPLDSDGRFKLRVPSPGDYRLTLRRLGSEFQEQILFEELTLLGTEAPWERDLSTGKLHIAGVDSWDGEGPPRVIYWWKGPGHLFGLAVPVGKGDQAIAVPSGNGELRAPNNTMDPDTWKVLRTITVPRGGELRVELSPSELH